MNQILATIAISYGSTFLFRYATNKVTDIVVDKTTQVVKSSAKTAWSSITNNNNNTHEIKEQIEYELISIDENNEVITDEVLYVTSKIKKKSICESWDTFDLHHNTI